MNRNSLIVHGCLLGLVFAGASGVAWWAHASPPQDASPNAMAAFGMGDASRHATQIARHLDEIGASPQQKAQVDALLEAAKADFAPFHDKARQDHEALVAALAQDEVDRAALEQWRLSHLQAADVGSQRKVQLIADIAEVLTPAQRRALAEQIGQHRAGGMMGHGH